MFYMETAFIEEIHSIKKVHVTGCREGESMKCSDFRIPHHISYYCPVLF